MEKRKNYYIIIGCIVLLILLVGIGIYFVFDKQEQNETTEKIVYKILKDKENNYSLQKENKENLEEVGEYTCESNNCLSEENVDYSEPKFVIYDNGYKFLTLENNKINARKIEELNKDNINAIHIENNDLIVEYKNNLVGIYEIELNQLKELLIGNYTLGNINNNKVILNQQNKMDIYDLEKKKIINTIYVPTNDFQIVENDQNTIYILNYSLPHETILNRIYDKNGEFILDQGYFQTLLHDGTIVMTDELIPYITGCGQMIYGYNNIQNFKVYQESTLIKTSKNYKSFMGFKSNDKEDYFMAIDEYDNLNIYNKDETILFKVEEWNNEKILGYWKIEQDKFILATGNHNDEFFTEYVYDLSGNKISSKQVIACQF